MPAARRWSQSRGRQQAWNDVSEVGDIAERDVTKRTNILVVGDLNPNTLAPGAVLSKRAARGVELRKAGQEIENLSIASLTVACVP